jgi:5-methylcytosine-specific restriction endonuclease McrA
MARSEFPKAIKVTVIKRATRDGQVWCESCKLPAKKFQIDHVIADAHGGKPVIENASLICEACYGLKNPKDTTIAAKLKRVEAKNLGATTPKAEIKSAGFPPSGKPKHERTTLPPRQLYRSAS